MQKFQQSKFDNVLVIVASYSGSLVRFKGPLIRALISKGYKVYALAPQISQKISEELHELGAYPIEIKFSRTGTNILSDLFSLYELVRIMFSLKPKVFIGYFAKPVIWGGIAAFITRIPKRVALIEGLGFYFTDLGTRKSTKELIVKKIVTFLYFISLKAMSDVLFLNKDDRKEFERQKIIKTNKSSILGPTGLEIKDWPVLKAVTDPINFLFVGRVIREKGIEEFLESAERIKAQYPKVTFTILGEIEEREGPDIYFRLKDLEKKRILSYPGFVPVINWFEKCSVFVLPSYREGVPRSTQEAMALAKPIITTDAPGCRETVEAGINGFIIPVGDANKLIEAMERFINNPNLIATMGENSRMIAERKFDSTLVNKKLFELTGL